MKLIDLIKKRQSVRKYDDTPVEREKIERCIEAARLAPSACNAQPWKFIVIDDPEIREAIAKKTVANVLQMNKFAPQAPVLVVIVTEKPNFTSKAGALLKDKDYSLIDLGIATEHFCLQATEEGLGTCIIGWFDEKAVKKILDIPKKRRVNLIVSVGYSASDKLREKIRKPVDEIRKYNSYE